MHDINQTVLLRPKTVSDGSRPTSRWSSSRLTTATTHQSNNSVTPLTVSRKKLQRPTRNSQQTFANMTKAKHEMEEIFKDYYTTNTKIDKFKQTVTGKRLVSPRQPPPTPAPPQNPFTETSSDVFRVKHCVSREDINLNDRHHYEYQSVINEFNKVPLNYKDQGGNNDSPMIIQSIKIHLSTAVDSIPLNSNLITPKTVSPTRYDELPHVKLANHTQDNSINSPVQKNPKRSKTAYGHRPMSFTVSSSIPITAYTLANNRRDQLNLSPLSTSTSNSSQEQSSQHVLTGTAMTTHQRPLTRSLQQNQRTKSNLSSQQSCIKISSFSNESDVSETPVHIVTQPIASIPSKCSRYVLITFPKLRTRHNIPTSVERLLLPERFPVLFQNILQSSDHNQSQK
ncbi:hypothetical protein I4U23_012598 [Adineta vaga]|nr:hypothetical protein I4U23_012598 [Adineta vaga]